MSIAPPTVAPPATPGAAPAPLTVLIVGSGFAGIGMAIRLQQSGVSDFLVLERAASVGGVWRDNRYPGIACDIESHLYSFSFEPNPDWTRTFAPGAEIRAYLERCADKHHLRDRIRFRCAATGARFDEEAGLWRVTTSTGETLSARVLVSGAGHALTVPIHPDIPGRESFAGPSFHSARWDHGVPLGGRRVAVIGTGASAIQIVPSIAPEVARLSVFQRTPPWILPRHDVAITPEARQRFRRFPSLQRAARTAQYWRHELMGYGFVRNPAVLELAGRLALRFMRKQVKDPALRERLTPAYTMGCKRVLLSNDYYPALCRDNVELVTDAITAIRPRSVVTADGREREVDVLVWATGFEAAEARPPFPITGRGGARIDESWSGSDGPTAGSDGPTAGSEAATTPDRAYLGTALAGFPNLFLVVGPNTGLGHSSMVFMMESQFAYILDAIATLRRRGLKFVDVRPEVAAEYNRKLQLRMAETVWARGGCRSWYYTRDGRNTTLWPGMTWEYRLRTRRFDPEAYDLVDE